MLLFSWEKLNRSDGSEEEERPKERDKSQRGTINPTGSATGAEGSVTKRRVDAMQNGSARTPRSNVDLKGSVPASDRHYRRVQRILSPLLIATSRLSILAPRPSLFLTALNGINIE